MYNQIYRSYKNKTRIIDYVKEYFGALMYVQIKFLCYFTWISYIQTYIYCYYLRLQRRNCYRSFRPNVLIYDCMISYHISRYDVFMRITFLVNKFSTENVSSDCEVIK